VNDRIADLFGNRERNHIEIGVKDADDQAAPLSRS
jgi:hypothetical protein